MSIDDVASPKIKQQVKNKSKIPKFLSSVGSPWASNIIKHKKLSRRGKQKSLKSKISTRTTAAKLILPDPLKSKILAKRTEWGKLRGSLDMILHNLQWVRTKTPKHGQKSSKSLNITHGLKSSMNTWVLKRHII